MRQSSSGRSRQHTRRIRPSLEGLESRQLLSGIGADQSPGDGIFLHNKQTFVYTTPQGTHVELQVIGRGSLAGTRVDNGVLSLRFSGTNSYSKIVSKVHGGTGQADLKNIFSLDLASNNAESSLSGIGSSVIKMINLGNFNLIAGGVIDVTSGIGNLNLNSVGPNTQINLRELPSDVTAGQSQSTTSSGVTNSFVTGGFQVQGLANINGEFISAGAIVNVTDPTNPGPQPAPPGIVIKINHINGNIPAAPNLLTDNKIFGIDATAGQVLRFDLTPGTTFTGQPNMKVQTATQDQSFAPITPPSGTPQAIALGRYVQNDRRELVLLVSTGSRIWVYDATNGGPAIGSFTTPVGFNANALGSTDTVTVMGSTSLNQLQMIDVTASVKDGTATIPSNPPILLPPDPYTPPAGFTLVGGLTGLPGSNRVYPTAAATFNSFQPTTNQLGLLTVSTSVARPSFSGGLQLVREFSTDSQQAIQNPGYTAVPTVNQGLVGVPEGSVDSLLAINTTGTHAAAPFNNSVTLLGPSSLTNRGTVTFVTQNPNAQITDLSESFRPELNGSVAAGTGPALIDVQGNIQSLRGMTANGLVLNNTGYLNLIRTGQISHSTILAQPIGHIFTPAAQRSNDVILISTNNRPVGKRGGVPILASNLYQIGPLSLTNDPLPPTS